MSTLCEARTTCFNYKGFTSLVLMIAFLVMSLSGILLYAGPHGPAPGWTFLGFGKGVWKDLHMTSATLFLIAAVFHLIWNWSMFWGYIKKKAEASLNLKLEMLVALIVGVALVAGTACKVPPLSTIVEMKRTLGGLWGGGEARPPAGHGQSPAAGHPAGEGQGTQYHGGR